MLISEAFCSAILYRTDIVQTFKDSGRFGPQHIVASLRWDLQSLGK